MLFMLFQLGADRYALPVHLVREVLPLIEFKQIPQAPPGVAGVMNYHGEPVPVLDLSQFVLGAPSRTSLSTRILLTNYQGKLLGLIAERATETIRREETDFVDVGVHGAATPYLGPVATDARGMIQRVELDRLLPESIRDLLFTREPNPQ